MPARRFTVDVVTAADGTATVYSPFLSGDISTIQYVKTDFADGVDFTITAETTGETIWTETNVNAAVIKHPRAAAHSTAGVALLYAAGGTAVTVPITLSRERVAIAIAQGGATKAGRFYITLA
jgi:hypothetical protein